MIKKELQKLYCDRQFSMMEVAKELQTTHARVYYWLKKYGISRRSWSDSAYVKQNPNGNPFIIPKKFSPRQQELLRRACFYIGQKETRGKMRFVLRIWTRECSCCSFCFLERVFI